MNLSRRHFARLGAGLAGAWALPWAAAASAGSGTPAAPVPDAIAALADFCVRTRYEQLPAAVVEATRNQILDTLGIALAAREQAGVAQLRDWTLETGGRAESLIWGSATRVPAESAARVNAAMSHALEFDDTYEPSFMHAAVVTIPAALAVAEMVGGVSGKDFIAATAVGVDLCCRMSRAGSPGADGFIVGWDPTPMYGYLGSAMVAARLMGLSSEQAVSAAGLAFHQLAGNSQGNLDGAHSKRLGPGFASYGGLMSARLVRRGVVGAQRVLEGGKGLYRQYHGGNYSRELLLGGLGERFAGPEVAFKPYPSCRGGHNAIDAALALAREHALKPADIARITIANGPGEFTLLSAPLETKQRPQGMVEAQFSNPWVVAAALQDGEVTLRHFTPQALQRDDLLALTRRTVTVEDRSLGRPGGGPGAVRIELQLRDGRTVSKRVAYAKGDPKNPMSPEEFRRKFHDCTDAAGMARPQADALLQRIATLEQLPDVSALARAMVIEA